MTTWTSAITEDPSHDERPVPPSEDGAPSSGPWLTLEEFEDAVGDALDLVPVALMDQLDNVVFLVEEEPPPEDPELLGVYDGVPLTERDLSWGGTLPDRITIFSGPLLTTTVISRPASPTVLPAAGSCRIICPASYSLLETVELSTISKSLYS